MATTTNFGWETPDDTDLVKDGAAAMRTLGNSIDTSFVDLKGGTTNQVLAKNSNTDLDFKWVADATGIPATIIDAKGDLIAGTAADTAGRLAVGTNGYVLTADSAETTGLKWASVAATKSYTLLNSGGTSLSGAATHTISNIGGYDQYFIFVSGASTGSAYYGPEIRFNSDSGSNYYRYGSLIQNPDTYAASYMGNMNAAVTSFGMGEMTSNNTSQVSGGMWVTGANTSGQKMVINMAGPNSPAGNGGGVARFYMGYYDSATVISSITILSGVNFDAGTIFIYGAA